MLRSGSCVAAHASAMHLRQQLARHPRLLAQSVQGGAKGDHRGLQVPQQQLQDL